MRHLIAISIVLSLIPLGPSIAGPDVAENVGDQADIFDIGLDAWNRGDYRSAHRIWLELAEAGNARAKIGVAAVLLQRLPSAHPSSIYAESNEEDERSYLNMRREGRLEAIEYIRSCAIQGLAACQRHYGEQLRILAKTDQDYLEAIKWTRRAADQGIGGAMMSLVDEYSDETKPYFDPVEAMTWGFILSKWVCLDCNFEMPGVSEIRRTLTSTQLAEARRRAREWRYQDF